MYISAIPKQLVDKLRKGMVIPAHPLALTRNRKLDVKRQKALARYYMDAGAGGMAVGVHTTQFEIRSPGVGLFEPVLSLASETVDEYCGQSGQQIFKIAGVCGRIRQAEKEAQLAVDKKYHAGLLSLSALKDAGIDELLSHCRRVAEIIPVFGFYLQPAVGGRVLPYEFWRRFAEIDNVIAIKIAPFNRYQTVDVLRAVCDAGRQQDIALYTGNDDNIVADLLMPFCFKGSDGTVVARIVGGLLGHWAVWTRSAVKLLERIRGCVRGGKDIDAELLTLAAQITDCNSAIFDAANGFSGCIAGIHEVLRRQGLMEGTWCLDAGQRLSPGQSAEIDRVYQAYPHLNDDTFVKEHLDRWLTA